MASKLTKLRRVYYEDGFGGALRGIAKYSQSFLSNQYGVSTSTKVYLAHKGFNIQAAVLYDLDRLDQYVPDDARVDKGWAINDEFRPALDNKYLFHRLLADHSDHLPTIYALIKDGQFHPRNGKIEKEASPDTNVISGVSDIFEVGQKAVFKPLAGGGGQDIYILEKEGDGFLLNGKSTSDERVVKKISSIDPCIATSHVEQAEYASHLYPESVNTIRMLTMVDPETQEVFSPIAIHRMGGKGSAPVDNWSSGGYCAQIDQETGVLGPAVQSPTSEDLEWWEEHPDTGSPIKGVRIPRWDNIRDSVTGIAEQIKFIPYIGWDIVVTPDSFTIIEANTNTDVDLLQVHKPLLEDKRAERFYRYHGVV